MTEYHLTITANPNLLNS